MQKVKKCNVSPQIYYGCMFKELSIHYYHEKFVCVWWGGGGVNVFGKNLLSYQRLSKKLKNLYIASIPTCTHS